MTKRLGYRLPHDDDRTDGASEGNTATKKILQLVNDLNPMIEEDNRRREQRRAEANAAPAERGTIKVHWATPFPSHLPKVRGELMNALKDKTRLVDALSELDNAGASSVSGFSEFRNALEALVIDFAS